MIIKFEFSPECGDEQSESKLLVRNVEMSKVNRSYQSANIFFIKNYKENIALVNMIF
jgi:hypothetical protein